MKGYSALLCKLEFDYGEKKLKFVFVVFSRHHYSNKIHVVNSSHQSLFSEMFVLSSQELSSSLRVLLTTVVASCHAVLFHVIFDSGTS